MHHKTLQHFVQNMRFMLDNLPGYFFIKDSQSCYVDFSQSIQCDFEINKNKLIGKSDFETPWEELAIQYQSQDTLAMRQQKADVYEPLILKKHQVFATRCVRVPVMEESIAVGIFGQVEILSSYSSLEQASKALAQLEQHKTLRERMNKYSHHIKLTPRETNTLALLARRKTAKEIGAFLGISYRTAETYIENIKNKMGVSSSTNIIDKAIELGLIDIYVF